MRKRKAFYWTDAADWIAAGDDPECMDAEEIAGLTTVVMVSQITGMDAGIIADRVVTMRKIWRLGKELPVQHIASPVLAERAKP